MNKEKFEGSLQLSREEMLKMGYKIVDILVDHFDSLQNKPVTCVADRTKLEKLLRKPLPENRTTAEKLLHQIQHEILSNIMHLDHPRFLAFIPGPNNFISAMADALASGFNVFAGTWLEASGPAEIELVTIDWLRQLCGFPDTAGGLFVSGGTAANLTALAVARHIKLKNRINNSVLYCSDQTHSCINRALDVLGFKQTQLRRFNSDSNYCLPVEDVQRQVTTDRAAGKIPFCIIANAGTTNTGAVDPLSELADFCAKEGIWLHVDGAYGAAAVLCDKGRIQLSGLEKADSLALDPHKWLFQPYEIGSVIVRKIQWLKDTFRILPDYLKDLYPQEEITNFCDFGIQLTRSFRALKLWMSLKFFGLREFRMAVARGIDLAEKAEDILAEYKNWEIVTSAQLGIVTFRYVPKGRTPEERDALNRQIVGRMIADKFALISSTKLKGRTVLRICTINPRTTLTDIQEIIRRLNHFANEINSSL